MKRLCKCGRVAEPNPDGRFKCKICRKIYLAERKKREKEQTENANIYRHIRPSLEAVLMLQEATREWGLHDIRQDGQEPA